MTLPELRGITARELIRALEADGFFLARANGSHHLYRRRDRRRVLVAHHALGDTFPSGTLHAMLNQTGWTEDDLVCLGLRRRRGADCDARAAA
jgi:predicted RNA binding protein YcfA (HicA-like mRNA interferase family)